MTFTCVGCGDSAKGWIPRGTTIGVNDCLKWTRDTDILILVNAPGKFKERIEVIKKSKAKVLTNSVSQWRPYFKDCQKIERLISFNAKILKNFVYMSQTSPIIAISYAIKLGATEIVIWGVDFMNHRKWAKGTKGGDREIKQYCRFFAECERIGVKVYLGAYGTAFDQVLPIWRDEEGMSHIDTWDENGVNHSWNIPHSFEKDLPIWERVEKWKTAHPEFDNFGDIDYANELMKKYTKE